MVNMLLVLVLALDTHILAFHQFNLKAHQRLVLDEAVYMQLLSSMVSGGVV